MKRRPARRSALFLCALAVAGCGLLPGPGPMVRLDNMTNAAAAVHVNGSWVGTYAPGSSVQIPLTGGGAPPYLVTVQVANGVDGGWLEVTADDIKAFADGSGGVAVSRELACGTVRLSIGHLEEPPPVAFAQLPPCS